jgi:putative SOS response-associated peptidase YedK
MPVIIGPADYQLWLIVSPATAKKLLLPFASGLTITPIRERVNNIENDNVELLLPLSMGRPRPDDGVTFQLCADMRN